MGTPTRVTRANLLQVSAHPGQIKQQRGAGRGNRLKKVPEISYVSNKRRSLVQNERLEGICCVSGLVSVDASPTAARSVWELERT